MCQIRNLQNADEDHLKPFTSAGLYTDTLKNGPILRRNYTVYRRFLSFAIFRDIYIFTLSHDQWWILGEVNEAVASGPPFFWGPHLENSIYSFGFAADVCSEDDSE